ncbi:MAG: hypothetical protein WA309_03535, partial [Pseudolabrys sp.]
IVAKVQTATTETRASRRDTMPLSERRTNITNNTKNKPPTRRPKEPAAPAALRAIRSRTRYR